MGNTFKLGKLVNGLTVNDNGSVGIGTSSLSSSFSTTLTIDGASSQGIVYRASGVDKAYTYWSSDFLVLGANTGGIILKTADTERVRITSSGNVGIGTSSPDALLRIDSNVASANNNMLYLYNADFTSTTRSFIRVRNNISAGSTYSSYFGQGADRKTYIIANDTNRNDLVINGDDGYIGMGTKNPISRLTIIRDSPFNTGDQALRIRAIDGDGYNLWFGASSNGYATIQSYRDEFGGATLALNPLNGGSVGIGTTGPTKTLEVYTNNSSTTTSSGLKITNFNTTTDSRAGIVFQNYDNNGAAIWSNRTGSTAGELVFGINPANGIAETNIVEKVRISRYGELLVNTTVATSSDPVHRIGLNGGSTLARLMIQERTGVWISWNTGSTNYGTVYLNGSVVVYGGQSDYRLKENIVEMESGLDKVMRLRPVTFNWKRDGSYGEGFIAHELQEIVPLAVTGVKDGLNELGEPDWQNVDKSHIVPVLVKAIQELKAEIDILKNK
jgi:hypothetical protein